MRLLFDTCIILDFLQNREPFSKDALKIILNMASYRINGYISAKSLTDIFYISKKYLGSNEKAKDTIQKLLMLFNIINTTKEDCKNAILSPTNDYEDAIMIESAMANEIDCIITRNIKDYLNSPIKVLTPTEFINLY